MALILKLYLRYVFKLRYNYKNNINHIASIDFTKYRAVFELVCNKSNLRKRILQVET